MDRTSVPISGHRDRDPIPHRFLLHPGGQPVVPAAHLHVVDRGEPEVEPDPVVLGRRLPGPAGGFVQRSFEGGGDRVVAFVPVQGVELERRQVRCADGRCRSPVRGPPCAAAGPACWWTRAAPHRVCLRLVDTGLRERAGQYSSGVSITPATPRSTFGSAAAPSRSETRGGCRPYPLTAVRGRCRAVHRSRTLTAATAAEKSLSTSIESDHRVNHRSGCSRCQRRLAARTRFAVMTTVTRLIAMPTTANTTLATAGAIGNSTVIAPLRQTTAGVASRRSSATARVDASCPAASLSHHWWVDAI